MPGPVEEDLKVIGTPLDWYGVNYYRPSRVGAPRPVTAAAVIDGLPFEFPAVDDCPLTDFGRPVVPEGPREVLGALRTRFGDALPPVYVTESGCAYADGPDADGRVADSRRIDYLDAHVRTAWQAIADGIDLRGYFVWSILDNFEWVVGTPRGSAWCTWTTRRSPAPRRIPSTGTAS
jgi:beta-glucosidase